MTPSASDEQPCTLRRCRPGDLDWIVQRHAALYAEERGWGARFEALVASIVADFRAGNDPEREGCWIAEVDGRPAGMVLLVRRSDDVAQLRLMLVEPWARGRGVGKLLARRCLDLARRAGYRRVRLWTQRGLEPSRHIYEAAGFSKVREEPHHLFGEGLVAETWELEL